MCQGGWRGEGGIEAAARRARQAAIEAQVAGAHPVDLPQALFNGRSRGSTGVLEFNGISCLVVLKKSKLLKLLNN